MAARVAVKVVVAVASDRYEIVLEIDHMPDDRDGVGHLVGATGELRGADGALFPRCSENEMRSIGGPGPGRERAFSQDFLLTSVDSDVADRVKNHPSVTRFRDFYAERLTEDLDRLLDHARSLGHKLPTVAAAEAAEWVAARDPSIRTALSWLRLRFVPSIRVEPVGMSGVRYDEIEVDAQVRNRHQHEAHGIRLRAVPLTGMLKSPIPGAEGLGPDAEAWGCPGGHLVSAEHFVHCSREGCTVGACDACTGTPRAGAGMLTACTECNAPVCGHHQKSCRACGEPLCDIHARRLSGREGVACSRCRVVLDDGRQLLAQEVAASAVSGRKVPLAEMEPSALSGRRALPNELVQCEESGRRILPDERVTCSISGKRVGTDLTEQSAVSHRPGLRSLMRHSAWSDRPCLPGEERICDETGALLLPDEIGHCSLTGRHVRNDLLEEDAERGQPVLRRLLGRSDVTGRWSAPEHLQRSELSGRVGLPDETLACDVCHKRRLADEVLACPETGRQACAEHFEACEVSGARVLSEGIGLCEVTGRRMRRALLTVCPETGKLASRDLFEPCQVSGLAVLPEGLGSSSNRWQAGTAVPPGCLPGERAARPS